MGLHQTLNLLVPWILNVLVTRIVRSKFLYKLPVCGIFVIVGFKPIRHGSFTEEVCQPSRLKGMIGSENSRKEQSGKTVEGSPIPPSSRTELTSEKGLSVRLVVPYNALVVQGEA